MPAGRTLRGDQQFGRNKGVTLENEKQMKKPKLKAGDVVHALQPITEEGRERGKAVLVHAQPGDVGRVLAIEGEWATVAWKKSTADAHQSAIFLCRSRSERRRRW
jgi:hypothetical protein